jgi:putative endonuclease
MFYTYVLRCCDGDLYVGSALDPRKRLAQHRAGRVHTTAQRLPVKLEYYEACRSELKDRLREKQLKTGFGRAYLKRRLEDKSRTPARNASRSDAGAAASRMRFIILQRGE